MINVVNNSHDPYFNLALEEYLLKHKNLDEDILILWRNLPTIVIGKNQNALEEINDQFVRDNHIRVVRRLSGGGAVYHDLGNLNFTFILRRFNLTKNDFSFFAGPVIHCLNTLGVKAEFDSRNDITIDGKKFSGNAQYFYRDRLLHHGTILFDSDLSVLGGALKPKKKYASRAIESAKSLVTNVKEHLQAEMDIETFKNLLARSIFSNHNQPYREYLLTEEDIRKAGKLVANRYGTWEWNYGSSPAFNFKRELAFAGGTLSLHMNIEQGFIKECKIYGDFFENRPVEELEAVLTGQRYDKATLQSLLKRSEVAAYIKGLTAEELFSGLF